MTISLASRRKSPSKAQCIAPHFQKLLQAVEAFDKRFTMVGHESGLRLLRGKGELNRYYVNRQSLQRYVCRATFRKSDRIDRATCRFWFRLYPGGTTDS
jgi:hypothetical protein